MPDRDATALGRIDPGGDDDAAGLCDRQDRRARLRPLPLRDADGGDDAVERGGQRLFAVPRAIRLQRGERGLRVGHRLFRLDELVLRRELLR